MNKRTELPTAENSSNFNRIAGATCQVGTTLTCASTVSAVSASVSWLTRARSPACVRLLSKKMKMAQQKDLTN